MLTQTSTQKLPPNKIQTSIAIQAAHNTPYSPIPFNFETSPATEPKSDEKRITLPQGWEVRNFQDAMHASSEPPPWVIQDLLLSQSATLISAHPHALKSVSLLQACLESVSHQKVWGHFAAPEVRNSLYIEIEDPLPVVELRIRELAKGLGLKDSDKVPGFHFLCVTPFELHNYETYLEMLVAKYELDFMGISTLQAAVGKRNMTQQVDMAPVMAMVVRLARLCPVILLTHAPWDRRNRRAFGTVTQTANFLNTMHFEKIEPKGTGHRTFVNVLLDSKMGVAESNFSLELKTETDGGKSHLRKLEYIGAGYPKGLQRDAILAAIREDPEASNTEIAQRTGATDRYVRGVRKTMERGKGVVPTPVGSSSEVVPLQFRDSKESTENK